MTINFVFLSVQLVSLPPVAAVLDSLHANGVNYSVYDNVSIEPTDARQVQHSIVKHYSF